VGLEMVQYPWARIVLIFGRWSFSKGLRGLLWEKYAYIKYPAARRQGVSVLIDRVEVHIKA
jgi:hypothetical protein